ncbi:MAG: BolA family transcriptional regulator [uncultured Thiotrichaceae bacterium]|uniref:BolA family transcriptional regulator n=1 Tax=uncultured Thiotrichaceae bacterium TaxID=298394 RepID=A0A6S6T6Z5_9GAMM|nr:MAG: BolA family transcriptional regulator [uncultured Thiotrichaceae bacterium]
MSISNENVEKLIKDGMENVDVTVSGDGYKYEAHIVSDAFEGLNTMKRHQMVYAILNDVITSGELHALTIKAYTPEEA